jgi:hypothetical protein
MAPSIRPVWEERLVCRRCGKEYAQVAGAIPGYVEVPRDSGRAPGDGEGHPGLGAEPIPAFSIFEGETPVCLDCAALLAGGGVELVSMLDEFQARWEEEYRRLRRR